MHAREWIAPAVALFMMKKIVSEYGKNPRVTANLDKFDWYIMPQVNPDGYEYSRTSVSVVIALLVRFGVLCANTTRKLF